MKIIIIIYFILKQPSSMCSYTYVVFKPWHLFMVATLCHYKVWNRNTICLCTNIPQAMIYLIHMLL